MSTHYLQTKRLTLRYMKEGEESLLFELDSNPEVMKYLTGGNPTPLSECKKGIAKILAYYQKYDKRYGLWFAEENESGKTVGWFLLRPDKNKPEDVKNPELGYRLKQTYWGRGYATEVSQALVRKAFEEFHCDSVFAITAKDNLASQNVMKKLGMIFTGYYTEEECIAPDGETAVVQFAIQRSDFLQA